MNAAVDPDVMLLLACARGDLAAFEALGAKHRGMLYRFPRHTLGQRRELDDIRKLFTGHRDEEARQRLENFHRGYPRWTPAEDLRVHLSKP